MEFDKQVAAATDTLIEALRFEMKVYADRMNALAEDADKEKLAGHLVMASIQAHVTRLNEASAKLAAELS